MIDIIDYDDIIDDDVKTTASDNIDDDDVKAVAGYDLVWWFDDSDIDSC